MADQKILRSTFNQSARDYDAIRPGYPEQIFDQIIGYSGISTDGLVLEIGCGTGQATLPFARCGFSILCLDPGENLLAIARQNLQGFPKVRFDQTTFEDWALQPGAFDLVYAATSFHWIPPDIGYPKAAQALKPGGTLAVFSNLHPRTHTGFFQEVQGVYAQFMPGSQEKKGHSDTFGDIERQVELLRGYGLFEEIETHSIAWSIAYSTGDYLRLLNTYSDHLALPEERRKDLYQAIANLIDQRYDGRVERPYLTVLYLAKTAHQAASL